MRNDPTSSRRFSFSRRWSERTATAAMVLVGFAIGSVGLAALAELGDDDPVLTDEFRLDTSDVDPAESEISTTTTTTTTAPPVEQIADTLAGDSTDHDDERRRGRGDDQRDPRGPRRPRA